MKNKKKEEEKVSLKDFENKSYEERKKEKRKIETEAEKTLRKRRLNRAVRLSLLFILLLLVVTYLLLVAFFAKGDFTIFLEDNLNKNSGIVLYEDPENKIYKRVLNANKLEFMDNIAEEWIKKDVHSSGENGSHNGDNYIAYSFYIENMGQEAVNYWSSIIIDDVIKNVDEAVRVKMYRNDEEPKTYAKLSKNGTPEPNTIPFYSNEYIFVEPKKELLKPGQRDRITLVIWLHGPDPDCIDPIIGGQLKMHMEITEEHIDKKKDKLPFWSLNKMKKE